MPAPTQTKRDTGPPTGAQIYDGIMGKIEPELTTAMLETLEEKYRDESTEEHQVRMARYDVAFAEYDKQYGAFLMKLKVRADACRKSARKNSEAADVAEGNEHVSELLTEIAKA